MTYRLPTYFMGMALLILACSSAIAAPSARALVKEGMRDFEAERYEEALQKFQEAKEADPEFEGLDLNIGHALMKLGRNEEAEQHYGEVLKTGKGANYKGDIEYNRGVSHFRRGSELIPDPTVEGLLKQGFLEQKDSPDGQPSLELKPEGQEALNKALEEYGKSFEVTKSAVPQLTDPASARANYELSRRQFDNVQKLIELFQPPEQQQQENEQQDKDDQEKKQEEQQQQENKDQQNEEDQEKQEQPQQEPQQNEEQKKEEQQQEQNQQKDEPKENQEQQQNANDDEHKEQQDQPQSASPQDAEQKEGMRPEDAMTLLNTLNDQPQEEQLKEMIRYQMRGQRPLNPDW